MTRDDQPGEDALPRDLEQALRSSRAELESSVAGKLDLEAGLAAVLSRKPAPAPPAANAAPGKSFEDYVQSRLEALYRFAFTLTGNRDDAADLVQEALVKVWRSWGKHAEIMEPVQMDRYVRAAMRNEHARKIRSRQREYLIDKRTSKIGSPAIDDADAKLMLRVIDQMPSPMRAALTQLLLNGGTVDEVAQILGLRRQAVLDFLMMARKAGLDAGTRFPPDPKAK